MGRQRTHGWSAIKNSVVKSVGYDNKGDASMLELQKGGRRFIVHAGGFIGLHNRELKDIDFQEAVRLASSKGRIGDGQKFFM